MQPERFVKKGFGSGLMIGTGNGFAGAAPRLAKKLVMCVQCKYVFGSVHHIFTGW